MFFTKEEIRRRNAEAGISEGEERERRVASGRVIGRVCRKMGFPFNTTSCALQLLHRFVSQYPSHGFDTMDLNATCIFLACKIEETIKKARDVIVCLHGILFGEELEIDSP
ncbi:hypothetical protein HDU67_003631, partial [Dinochytrium kinnereticum]